MEPLATLLVALGLSSLNTHRWVYRGWWGAVRCPLSLYTHIGDVGTCWRQSSYMHGSSRVHGYRHVVGPAGQGTRPTRSVLTKFASVHAVFKGTYTVQ